MTIDDVAHTELQGLIERTFLNQEGSPTRVLAFVGIDNDDAGVGEVAVLAAESLAGSVSRPVCIIDANVAAPTLGGIFHLESSGGLMKALEQGGPPSGQIHRIGAGNLFVIPAGRAGTSSPPPDQFHARFTQLVTSLRETFEYLLIVSPDLAAYSQVSTIASVADGFVLVVEAGVTRRKSAIKAAEDLRAARIPIAGAVLNRRKYPIPDYIYRRL